jgi:hypothetical protein
MAVDFQAEASPAPRDVALADDSKKPVPAQPRRFDWRAMAMMVGGGLATGALVAGFAAGDAGSAPGFELQIVAQDDIAAASQSLVAAVAGSLVDEARACRTPLAYLLIRSDGTSERMDPFPLRSVSVAEHSAGSGGSANRCAIPCSIRDRPWPDPRRDHHGGSRRLPRARRPRRGDFDLEDPKRPLDPEKAVLRPVPRSVFA